MRVLVADEKHGVTIYASALACLNQRIKFDFWYSDEETVEAKHICASRDERAADEFLGRRNDHEYEGTSWETVIE